MGPLSDVYAEYGRLIHETALHAIAVVGAMAAASPAEEEAAAPLAEVARHVVEAVSPRARELGVHLALDDQLGGRPELIARPLAQILFNLLDNALKATAPGGAVTVRLDEDEGLVRIEVRDTGGAEPKEPAVGGGLGLSIVRALCAAQGGELQLETAPQGAVARVWLAPVAS